MITTTTHPLLLLLPLTTHHDTNQPSSTHHGTDNATVDTSTVTAALAICRPPAEMVAVQSWILSATAECWETRNIPVIDVVTTGCTVMQYCLISTHGSCKSSSKQAVNCFRWISNCTATWVNQPSCLLQFLFFIHFYFGIHRVACQLSSIR